MLFWVAFSIENASTCMTELQKKMSGQGRIYYAAYGTIYSTIF